jgi:hypothetical protein
MTELPFNFPLLFLEVFMSLTDAQQAELLAVVEDIQLQLRGPGLAGWPQLGVNSKGQNRTLIDFLSALGKAMNVSGMSKVTV